MNKSKREKLRSVELEILDEIVRICDKYDITYFLAYGTLLGAIRHKGFIPWDDDIDIAMSREDYNKFKDKCKNELDDKYFLQNPETEPLYWMGISHLKVRKNGTLWKVPDLANLDVHKGIFVDIFVLDHASKEKSILQDIQAILFEKIKGVRWHKTKVASQDTNSLRHKLVVSIASLFKLEHLLKLQRKVVSINKDVKSQYYIRFGSSKKGHRKQTMPKEVFHPPKKVEFEGKLYNAPNDWDEYLTRIYGDYMELPSEDKRRSHNPEKIILK